MKWFSSLCNQLNFNSLTALFSLVLKYFPTHTFFREKELVGEVEFTAVHKSAIVVTTTSGTFAAIGLKTGRLLWRYIFTGDQTLTNAPLIYEEFVHVRRESGQCAVYNIHSGKEIGVTGGHKGNFFMVIVPGMLRGKPSHIKFKFSRNIMLGGADNAMNSGGMAGKQFPEGMVPVGVLTKSFEREGKKFANIEAIHFIPRGKGEVVKYDTDKGSLTKQANMDCSWATENLKYVSSDDSMAVLKNDFIYYKVFGVHEFKKFQTNHLPWKVVSLYGLGKSFYLAHGDVKSAILKIDDKIKIVKHLNDRVVGALSGESQVTLLSQHENYEVNVHVLELETGEEVGSYELEGRGRGGAMSVEVLPASHHCTSDTSGVTLRGLLVLWEDGTVSTEGVEKKCGWVRDESMASVLSAYVMDIAASDVTAIDLTKEGEKQSWNEMLVWQMDKLQSEVKGKNEIVVVATSVGKLHAVQPGTGEIIWSLFLKNMQPHGTVYPIHLLSADPPRMAILGSSQTDKDEEDELMTEEDDDEDEIMTEDDDDEDDLSEKSPTDTLHKTIIMVVNPLDGTLHHSGEIEGVLGAGLTPQLEEEFNRIIGVEKETPEQVEDGVLKTGHEEL